MPKCNYDDCDLTALQDSQLCILHCEKSNYQKDAHKNGFLNSFNEALIDYIADNSFEEDRPENDKESLKRYLRGTADDRWSLYLNDKTFILRNIKFPDRRNRDNFDYRKVLKKLSKIHFDRCEFCAHVLGLSQQLFFQDCIFQQKYQITNHEILENANDAIYQNCSFKRGAALSTHDNDPIKIKDTLFCDCSFEEDLILENTTFERRLFANEEELESNLQKIKIYNCTFEDKFILNNQKMDEFSCLNSVFKEKVELKNNKIKIFNVDNSNFEELVDFYSSQYEEFSIKKSIFDAFAGFEKCKFGIKEESNETEKPALFLYATFMGFVNFRSTGFSSGLDIKNINLKEPPNFLGIKVNAESTNRETFRIIKNSFDKIGNNIEANKFFRLEMKKYKQELKDTREYSERIIFSLNEMISDFGQSYIRPIGWMIFFSFLYYLCVLGYENNILYIICPRANGAIEFVSRHINGMARNILPFQKFIKEGMEFISLIFYAAFSALIWQTIVALKRHTRR